jgi:hypothetical protein
MGQAHIVLTTGSLANAEDAKVKVLQDGLATLNLGAVVSKNKDVRQKATRYLGLIRGGEPRKEHSQCPSPGIGDGPSVRPDRYS